MEVCEYNVLCHTNPYSYSPHTQDDEFLESEYTEGHMEDDGERKYSPSHLATMRRTQSGEEANTGDDHDSEVSGSVQSQGSLRHDSRHDSNSKDIVFFRDVGQSKSNATYNDYTYKG